MNNKLVQCIIFLYLVVTNVYDNEKEKENWRILTNKEIHARVKKPTIIETVR